jgi:hypothetical protein
VIFVRGMRKELVSSSFVGGASLGSGLALLLVALL